MTKTTKPEMIEDGALDQTQGGAVDAFFKLEGLKGESKDSMLQTSYDLVGKRDIGTGADVPTESFSLNYEKI